MDPTPSTPPPPIERPSTGRSNGGKSPAGQSLAPQLVLRDLLDDLLWPGLLRAGAMSLRPERIAIAYVTLLLITLAMHAARLVPGGEEFLAGAGTLFSTQSERATNSIMYFNMPQLGGSFYSFFEGLANLTHERPWAALACAVPWLLVAPIGASAIARLTAIETAHRVMSPWPVGVGFAARAAKASVLAVIGPAFVLLLGMLGLAVAGAALFSIGEVGVAGSVFLFVALAVCAGMVLLAAGWILGLPLFVPAVACEGPDPIDAVQRVLAYLVGRPLRLAAYSLLLLAEMTIVVGVVSVVIHATLDVTAWGLTLFCGPEARAALGGNADTLSGAWKTVAGIAHFWREAFLGIVSAVIFSFVCCGWTIAYLLIRQLHDGQDRSEIWMPGMIPGTLASETTPDGDDDE